MRNYDHGDLRIQKKFEWLNQGNTSSTYNERETERLQKLCESLYKHNMLLNTNQIDQLDQTEPNPEGHSQALRHPNNPSTGLYGSTNSQVTHAQDENDPTRQPSIEEKFRHFYDDFNCHMSRLMKENKELRTLVKDLFIVGNKTKIYRSGDITTDRAFDHLKILATNGDGMGLAGANGTLSASHSSCLNDQNHQLATLSGYPNITETFGTGTIGGNGTLDYGNNGGMGGGCAAGKGRSPLNSSEIALRELRKNFDLRMEATRATHHAELRRLRSEYEGIIQDQNKIISEHNVKKLIFLLNCFRRN